jgi:intracellular sulfur oxidation DsrE/DsrF family protein
MNLFKNETMYKIFLFIVLLCTTSIVNAQTEHQKIVFDLNSSDTAAHSTVLRQFTNVLKASPDTELELVCHGQAINMFIKDKLYFEEKIKELKSKGAVSYKVCANSMRRLNVDKSQISGLAEIVPVAMLELASKQKEGWSYIKAGN